MKRSNLAIASVDAAIDLARQETDGSIKTLADFVKVPSLTGEEGVAQEWVSAILTEIGLETEVKPLDIEATFAAFPDIAQYPTHWEHDLILPYSTLPTYEALKASGLENVLNYEGRPNVVATLRGTGGGRSLILNGHVDTVTIEPKDEWTKDPFGAEISDGRMYGRGTSDMKGGVVAAMMAVRFLKRAKVKLRGDVLLQCVVNEEHAGNGSLDLMRQGCRADAAIVLEPTENRVAVDHPGGLYWQIRVPGVQRSPGARWRNGEVEGVSAIEKLPIVVQALERLEREFVDSADTHENSRAPFSLVMGTVTGGFYETVTAGEVVLRGSAYFAPHTGSVRDIMERFRTCISTVNENDDFLSMHPARLEFLHHDDSTHQDATIAPAETMVKITGGNAAASVVPGPFCCDMRHLVNQGGIPSIIFGPGTIAQAHKPDEHIEISQYLESIEHLIYFIAEWCEVDTN